MSFAVTMLLSKTITGVAMSPSMLGRQKLLQRGPIFMAEQGMAFQEYLVKKIIDATFKERIINSGDDFRKFITDTKKDTVETFKKLNPYVAEIRY